MMIVVDRPWADKHAFTPVNQGEGAKKQYITHNLLQAM